MRYSMTFAAVAALATVASAAGSARSAVAAYWVNLRDEWQRMGVEVLTMR